MKHKPNYEFASHPGERTTKAVRWHDDSEKHTCVLPHSHNVDTGDIHLCVKCGQLWIKKKSHWKRTRNWWWHHIPAPALEGYEDVTISEREKRKQRKQALKELESVTKELS